MQPPKYDSIITTRSKRNAGQSNSVMPIPAGTEAPPRVDNATNNATSTGKTKKRKSPAAASKSTTAPSDETSSDPTPPTKKPKTRAKVNRDPAAAVAVTPPLTASVGPPSPTPLHSANKEGNPAPGVINKDVTGGSAGIASVRPPRKTNSLFGDDDSDLDEETRREMELDPEANDDDDDDDLDEETRREMELDPEADDDDNSANKLVSSELSNIIWLAHVF
jgi:hypothetical protein